VGDVPLPIQALFITFRDTSRGLQQATLNALSSSKLLALQGVLALRILEQAQKLARLGKAAAVGRVLLCTSLPMAVPIWVWVFMLAPC
jgi:hypothetical protein